MLTCSEKVISRPRSPPARASATSSTASTSCATELPFLPPPPVRRRLERGATAICHSKNPSRGQRTRVSAPSLTRIEQFTELAWDYLHRLHGHGRSNRPLVLRLPSSSRQA